MSNILIATTLLIIALVLWFASKRGYIQNRSLDTLDKIASIMAFLTAIAVLIWPMLETGKSFEYPVRVQSQDTSQEIPNAQVTIEIVGKAPLDGVTDVNGFVRISIPASYAGQKGRLIVEAKDYKRYVQEIDLAPDALSDIIQLESLPEDSRYPLNQLPIRVTSRLVQAMNFVDSHQDLSIPPDYQQSKQNPEVLQYYPMAEGIEIGVDSLLNDESIRLSKTVFVRLIRFEPSEISSVRVGPPMGGNGSYRYFTLNVDPESVGQTAQATFLPSTEGDEDLDFFVVEPGGFEVMRVLFDFDTQGIYTIEVGLEYYYQGNPREIWPSDTMVIRVPERYFEVNWMTGEWSEHQIAKP